MKKNGVLNFILGDHLGSTSLVTDASGNIVNQTQYKAWGEVRHSSGSEMTKYQYTGQYSYASDFGLMFYNARWYDPALGCFAQADSIVPGGVQDWDRYAYANNLPLNYIDPSEHTALSDASYEEDAEKPQNSIDDMLTKYGVKLKGNWDFRYKAALVLGVLAAAGRFGDVLGKSPLEIFKAVYGELTFTW